MRYCWHHRFEISSHPTCSPSGECPRPYFIEGRMKRDLPRSRRCVCIPPIEHRRFGRRSAADVQRRRFRRGDLQWRDLLNTLNSARSSRRKGTFSAHTRIPRFSFISGGDGGAHARTASGTIRICPVRSKTARDHPRSRSCWDLSAALGAREDAVLRMEIKAILASGQIEAKRDIRGIDHIFTYFAMGTRRTMFEGISSVLPGSFLRITLRPEGELSDIQGEDVLGPAVSRPRIRASSLGTSGCRGIWQVFSDAVRIVFERDVPVVSYLSGGVDSTAVASTATRIRGESIPTFTIRIADPR